MNGTTIPGDVGLELVTEKPNRLVSFGNHQKDKKPLRGWSITLGLYGKEGTPASFYDPLATFFNDNDDVPDIVELYLE